jgi:Ca2+-binding RTX toxin-like protein
VRAQEEEEEEEEEEEVRRGSTRRGLKTLIAAIAACSAVSALAAAYAEATFPGKPGMLLLRMNPSASAPRGLFTVNPDGSGFTQRIASPAGFVDLDPAWSPTGKLFAWRRHESLASSSAIMVAKPDGSGATAVGPAVVGTRGDPGFAPSGNALAHTCDPEDICSLSLGGAGGRLVTGATADDSPVYARDGRLFFVREDATDSEIWVRAPGGAVRQLTDNAVDDLYPDVSPDGRTVVLSRQVGSGLDVIAIDAGGGDEINLTNDPSAFNRTPVFSPTGRQIAFSRGNSPFETDGTAHVMPSTGGPAVPITTPELVTSLDWQPIPVKCGGRRSTQVGTASRDLLTGTKGPDVFAGLGGRDVLRGKGGRDTLCGGGGRDRLLGGGGGKDSCVGGKGADRAKGCELGKGP